jgi:hypothetical protein
LGEKDASLAKLASEHIPKETASSPSPHKKRKAADTSDDNDNNNGSGEPTKKKRASPTKKKKNANSDLAEREERAMSQLETFIEERGGSAAQVGGYSARVTKKASGKYDVNFYNEVGRRFRSMLEVGRFLHLITDAGRGAVRRKGVNKTASSREKEAEKKKLRRELEKLRKAQQRAVKSLDDLVTDEKDSLYPIEDVILMEEEANSGSRKGALVTPTTCAAAGIPDIDGFPGIPEHCVPDVLMAWDFLCTFERVLNLTPIALDDFAAALAYIPPEGQVLGDDVLAPPVYLAEAHLGLLKLLLQDKSSDDWWWSTLESGEAVLKDADYDETIESGVDDLPVIQMDMASLLAEAEDPLITTSWLKVLEDVEKNDLKGIALKRVIKAAMNVASNKWVMAYLRKALDGYKSSGAGFTRRAIIWLVRRLRKARPDLVDRSVTQETLNKERAAVVEEVSKQMEKLSSSVPAVTDEDAVSDVEYDDEDSDDSDDEDADDAAKTAPQNESERPASSIPPKPLPEIVDLLLPPSKPQHNADFVNAFSWAHMIGASTKRILHRRKRVWNEIDDNLRLTRELRPLTVSERRQRESMVTSRVLTECVGDLDQDPSRIEKSIGHLCSGGSYLELSAVDRLCILRLLIEAAYDTIRVYEVVDGNYKQRMSAMKALDVEQRRAKREAKEKAAADEAAAREQLAMEARDKFLDETREEIRKLNEKSKEFTDEIIESLTEEDIIAFDEDITADYEALPGAESFSKTEVKDMVARMREETAFDTDSLRVLTMDELLQREIRQLEEWEGQFQGFGGEDALLGASLDRETKRSIERLQRDVDKARTQMEKLPEVREKALEQLKDAMQDGTIKVLRSAVAAGKKAVLSGPDDETGGIWAVGLMRDAAVELDNAKQNKRVADAQKDLVAKRNKCFIRSEPLGRDRFRNRFWTFDNDEVGHVWVETDYTLQKSGESVPDSKPPSGFLNLMRDPGSIVIGAKDMEEDFLGKEVKETEELSLYSRREYHSAGFTPSLVQNHWGCHATEDTLRAAIKKLDSRGIRENELKINLKEALEETVGTGENQDNIKEEKTVPEEFDGQPSSHDTEIGGTLDSGDEAAFETVKQEAMWVEDVSTENLENMSSAIGGRVRVRQVVEKTKDNTIARYENGAVTGWKIRRDEVEVAPDVNAMEDDEEDPASRIEIVNVPIWKVLTDRGHIVWLTGSELVESLSRFAKSNAGRGYFENDTVFLSYRNALGRHCGRAADAPYASSPIFLARLMVKREAELYAKLKIRSYDNNWGGKSGARALWTNSMKDYAYDLQTAKQGLMTLENAFFDLTGEFDEYANVANTEPDAKALLSDPKTLVEIELETIEKNIPGLWNSPASRAVFIEIVSSCKSTGFLSLAFDLLCRNTMKYLQRHKLLNVRTQATASSYEQPTARTTRRRMNAWQQANQDEDEDWY